jgi:hypothetical protein
MNPRSASSAARRSLDRGISSTRARRRLRRGGRWAPRHALCGCPPESAALLSSLLPRSSDLPPAHSAPHPTEFTCRAGVNADYLSAHEAADGSRHADTRSNTASYGDTGAADTAAHALHTTVSDDCRDVDTVGNAAARRCRGSCRA